MNHLSTAFNTAPTSATAQDGRDPPGAQKASEPFDRDEADVVLRSSDNVDFHVYRVILSLGSPVFETMFSLPQPQESPDLEKPVIDVSEDSKTLDPFLRVLYPISDPHILSFPLIRQVLTAAVKYEASAALSAMKKALVYRRLLEDDPLRCFAIACCFGLEEEAQIAAEKAVIEDRALGEYCAELDEISASAYFHLRALNRSRRVTKSTKHSGVKIVTVNFTNVGPFCPEASERAGARRRSGQTVEPTHPFDSPDADLIFQSSDSVNFRVSRTIITLASPEMLTLGVSATALEPIYSDQTGSPVQSDREGATTQLPIYALQEHSTVLDALLRMCYPTDHLPIDPDILFDLLAAVRRYKIVKAERIIRDSWPALMKRGPLRCYFTAVRCGPGWETEARAAARELVRQHSITWILNQYLPEMEYSLNGPYRRLLVYLGECSQAATAAHQLSLSLSRTRFCSTCGVRYASKLSTDSSLSLHGFSYTSFQAILKETPQGSAIALSTGVAQSFMSAAVASHIPCTKSASGALCSPSDNLAWSLAVLEAYAHAVDNAVNKVELQLVTDATSA